MEGVNQLEQKKDKVSECPLGREHTISLGGKGIGHLKKDAGPLRRMSRRRERNAKGEKIVKLD